MKVLVSCLDKKVYSVETFPEETVRILKDKIIEAAGLKVRKEDLRLLYGGRQLIDGDTLFSYNIQGGSQITQLLRMRGGGFMGPDVEFVREEKTSPAMPDTPPWIILSEGLNIHGKCFNKDCQVYNKTHGAIALKWGFGKFEVDEIKTYCSQCNEPIKITGFGFLRCKWKYSGVLTKGAKFVKGEGKATGNTYKKTLDGRRAEWDTLTIEISSAD